MKILGQAYQLEERICICGCNRPFLTLATSTQRVASAYECTDATPNAGRLEFTGTTAQTTKKAKRENPYEKKRKRKVGYTRNFSKWDKEPQ